MRAQVRGNHYGDVLRGGLAALATIAALTGGWALVLPGSLYRDFPGLGMHWVAAAPPYSENLVTDFGAALLGIAAGLGVAAVLGQRRVVQVVLLAALVQAVPHLIFHLSHPDLLPAGQEVASRLALAVPVGLTLGLLWLSRHHNAKPTVAAETMGPSSTAGSSR